jgi:hypothetical protein
VTPAEYVKASSVELLGLYYDVMVGIMGSAPISKEDFIEMMQDEITQGMPGSDPIEGAILWQVVSAGAPAPAQSGSVDPIDYGITAWPMGPTSFLALPEEWSWTAAYSAYKDAAEASLDGTSFESALLAMGVTTLVVKDDGMAVYLDLAAIDETSQFSTPIVGMLNQLAASGLEVISGTVGMGVEWNDAGFMQGIGLYLDGVCNINTNKMFPVAAQASIPPPSIVNEEVGVVVSQTAALPGVTPPSLEEIIAGDIGVPPVDTTDTDGGAGLNIPGYPLGVVGALGILAVAIIAFKKRQL